jgi:N-acetyl-gamma-glutamyl-phosphate reductase
MINVAIIGVSGYAGGEAARILSQHPEVEVTFASSESNAGKPLSAAYPGLTGTRAGRLICHGSDMEKAADTAEVIFLAQESGAAMKAADSLLAKGKKIIDLSADFRLRDASVFETWYKIPHSAPHLLNGSGAATGAVYGLPEWNFEALESAQLVANPGCHVTAALLALLPLLDQSLIETRGIIIDSKTGVSGAGRTKSELIYRFSEMNESMRPYNLGGTHRHIPEIEQNLSDVAGESVVVTFAPHLAPMTRGILSTCYARLKEDAVTAQTITDALRDTYSEEGAPFVIVRDSGDWPSTKDVFGSNFCHLSATVDSRTGSVIIVSAIDNLVKGAAGQAVQNMNLMCGLPETAGLEGGGQWP